MKKSMSLTGIALLLVVSSLSAATHFVSLESTNPAPPYASWVTAATNIQQAVDAAAAGDEVVVTNGVYDVGQTDVGNGPSRVAITNAISVRSVNGSPFTLLATGIPGQATTTTTNTDANAGGSGPFCYRVGVNCP